MRERLQKIIARAGIASRRAAEDFIVTGRVRVNARIVTELGAQADPRVDKIEVDGRRILAQDLAYYILHKPKNVVSTLSDPEGRPTVAEYLKGIGPRLYPVGRLDFATSGVLLVTNDGEFTNALLHPTKAVPKTYVVKVGGKMSDANLDVWRKGIDLEDGRTLPAQVRLIRHEGDKTWFEITIREGRNQQLRRMGEATGFLIMRLVRTSFAGIDHEGLRPGQLRPLSANELKVLKEIYGVPQRIPRDVPKRAPAARVLEQHKEAVRSPRKPAPSWHKLAENARDRAVGSTPAGENGPARETPSRSARTDRSGTKRPAAARPEPRARARADRGARRARS